MNRMWEIREGETPEKDYGYSRNRRYMRSPMMTRQEMSEYDEGYEEVKLIDTADGMFMSKGEAKVLGLTGSSLLIGKK